MEIHPIHGPVLSLREFLVHLSIITIGILIALGLEGAVEWQHHRALVREARTNLAIEISTNRKTMETYLEELRSRREELSKIASVMQDLEQRKDVSLNLGLHYDFHSFDSGAWHAATASGAVIYMSYNELQRYTDVYEGQEEFQALQMDSVRKMGELSTELQLLDPRRLGLLRKDPKTWPVERFEEIERRANQEMAVTQLLKAVAQSTSEAYAKVSPQDVLPQH